MQGLEKTFNEWFVTKAPFQLPTGVKEWIVQWSPWITLVILILFAPLILGVLALGTVVGGVASSVGVNVGPLYWLSFIVLLAQAIVMAVSIPKLMKRSMSGWRLVYYATLANFVYNVLRNVTYPAGLIFGVISAAIGAAISLYFLFQIRSYYK